MQVVDPDTGRVLASTDLENNYLVICAGNRYVAHEQKYANGTVIITIKREKADNA